MDLKQKLRIIESEPLYVINAPNNLDVLLPGLTIISRLPPPVFVRQIMVFAVDGTELAHLLKRVEHYIGHQTLFWICYPKKTGAIQSDLVLMKTWDIVFGSGYRGQTSISIDADWTGMRFTNAPKPRPTKADVPLGERATEGIDYINRTATLPADATALLSTVEGLTDYFHALSFSHKREYLEAIADAKKPETRIRRIEKMVDMLTALRASKPPRKKQAGRKK
jgi:hypothetical protein